MLTIRSFPHLLDPAAALALGAVSGRGGFDAARAFPAMNGWETQDAVVFEAELPGFRPEDVEVLFEGRVLTLKGRREVAEPEGAAAVLRERASGAFERALRVSVPVDAERIEAEFRDGVLRVRLPKAASARSRRIPVSVG